MRRILIPLALVLCAAATVNPLSSGNWATLRQLAAYRGASERSARSWATRHYFPLYKIRGVQGVVVDLDEANAALDALVASGKVRPGYGSFHGATITEVVTEVVR